MMKIKDGLWAPLQYWELPHNIKEYICNACGPKSKFDLIPDTIWFLDISKACDIHDYMYYISSANIEDKKTADRIFLINMNELIERNTKKYINIFKLKFKNPLYFLRKARALNYYLAVKHSWLIFYIMGCNNCHDAIKYFEANGIKFKKYDVMTKEGLAKAAYYGILDECKKWIPIIIEDNEYIDSNV
jgi:hypothetical protein